MLESDLTDIKSNIKSDINVVLNKIRDVNNKIQQQFKDFKTKMVDIEYLLDSQAEENKRLRNLNTALEVKLIEQF